MGENLSSRDLQTRGFNSYEFMITKMEFLGKSKSLLTLEKFQLRSFDGSSHGSSHGVAAGSPAFFSYSKELMVRDLYILQVDAVINKNKALRDDPVVFLNFRFQDVLHFPSVLLCFSTIV